jgi:diguanylate cyclase (GGDEF)-like protein
MTRISNRRGFLALSKYSLDLCKRQLFPATLVFFDLDRFKAINDQHGHAQGDTALRLFAEQMRETFRTSDLFARIGGDEFVALLTNTTEAQVSALLARFNEALQARCSALGLPFSIEFSHGFVTYDPLKHASIEDMLREADSAMYAAKHAKRGGAG